MKQSFANSFSSIMKKQKFSIRRIKWTNCANVMHPTTSVIWSSNLETARRTTLSCLLCSNPQAEPRRSITEVVVGAFAVWFPLCKRDRVLMCPDHNPGHLFIIMRPGLPSSWSLVGALSLLWCIPWTSCHLMIIKTGRVMRGKTTVNAKERLKGIKRRIKSVMNKN